MSSINLSNGTLEQLEQRECVKLSNIFDLRQKSGDVFLHIYLQLNNRRRCIFIKDYNGIFEMVNFSMLFRLNQQEILCFNSLLDYNDLEEFEFLLVDRSYAILKLKRKDKETSYFSSSGIQLKINQFVLSFDFMTGKEPMTAFIAKVMKHQTEFFVMSHRNFSCKNDREVLRFSTIMEQSIREEVEEDGR